MRSTATLALALVTAVTPGRRRGAGAGPRDGLVGFTGAALAGMTVYLVKITRESR